MRILRLVIMLVLAGALDFSAPLVSEARDVPEELQDAFHGHRRRHQVRLLPGSPEPATVGADRAAAARPRPRITAAPALSSRVEHRARKVSSLLADPSSPSDDH